MKQKKIYAGGSIGIPSFFGHFGHTRSITGIRTLTKVLESALSDSQTD